MLCIPIETILPQIKLDQLNLTTSFNWFFIDLLMNWQIRKKFSQDHNLLSHTIIFGFFHGIFLQNPQEIIKFILMPNLKLEFSKYSTALGIFTRILRNVDKFRITHISYNMLCVNWLLNEIDTYYERLILDQSHNWKYLCNSGCRHWKFDYNSAILIAFLSAILTKCNVKPN